MSDANQTNNESPKQLGSLASWGLLGGTAIAALYVLPVVLPVIAAHLITTAVVAAAAGTAAVVKKDKLEGVKNFFTKTASLYKQAFTTARGDWKKALGWGRNKAAERAAEATATQQQAPANENTSKLAGAASKAAFNGAKTKGPATTATTPEAKPAPQKAAGPKQ
ncbi:MAG: hypothetical protein PW788_09405 [Micavibrio sp.]|nr:hypothetical protein [Micavibrio sp.]